VLPAGGRHAADFGLRAAPARIIRREKERMQLCR
jgi:hypothetical protein